MPAFKIVRKGYDRLEVDKYIDDLNSRLQQLTDKEYYINKAIVTAEQTAAGIINKAEEEKEEILKTAKEEADRIVTLSNNQSDKLLSKTNNQLALIHQRESNKLEDLKIFINDQISYLNSFKEDYALLAKKYFETPNNEEFNRVVEGLNNIITLVDSFNGKNNEQ